MLGKSAVCCDLAAEDREHRGLFSRRLDIEDVVAGNRARIGGFVVEQGAYARKRGDDLSNFGCVLEVAVDDGEEIFDLAPLDAYILGSPLERNIRSSDQGKIALIGIDENYPLISVLKQISLVAIPEFTRDNVAPLDEPNTAR